MKKINKELDKAWETFKVTINDICKNITSDKSDEILVPDNIHLWHGRSIFFNDDKQLINWNLAADTYQVNAISTSFGHQPHKLIPADPGNLEIGYIYYRSAYQLQDIHIDSCYGIYVGKGNFIYIENDLPLIGSVSGYDTIMKAVSVEG